jgi:hypothetical protein
MSEQHADDADESTVAAYARGYRARVAHPVVWAHSGEPVTDRELWDWSRGLFTPDAIWPRP